MRYKSFAEKLWPEILNWKSCGQNHIEEIAKTHTLLYLIFFF